MAHASGQAERFKGFDEQRMAEYDLEAAPRPTRSPPTT